MTLTTTSSRNDYAGSGTTGPFAYNFRIFAATDLLVTRESASGVESTLVWPADFSVSGVGNRSGGSITLTAALAGGETLTVQRVRPLTQTTDIRNQGVFYPETIEDAFDNSMMVDQQLQEQLDRCLKIARHLQPVGSGMQLTEMTAGKVVTGTGTGFTMSSLPSGAIALPGAGRTVPTVSAYLANNAVFNVKDYGAVGDNVTDDAPAIQLAINAAKAARGIVLFPSSSAGYRSASPLNVTGTSDIRFISQAGTGSSYPTIWGDHAGHVFDLSNSSFLHFEYLSVRPRAGGTQPQTAFFMARNAVKDSAGNHTFIACSTYGAYSQAAVYQYGSESNEYHACYWANTQPGGKAFINTGFNFLGLSSSFITIATGGVSNITCNIFGGSIVSLASGLSKALYVEAASSLRVYGTWMGSGNGAVGGGGHSLIYIDTTNSPSDELVFSDIVGENFGAGALTSYGVYVGGGANTSTSWKISGRFPVATNAIYADDTSILDGLIAERILSTPASSIGRLQYSILTNVGSLTVRIFDHYNVFTGAVSAFTRTGTVGSVVIDPLAGMVYAGLVGAPTLVATPPAAVNVPTGAATTLFDARAYLGGGASMWFTINDNATIYAVASVVRRGDGTVIVTPHMVTGSGVAFSVSGGFNVQLTHTVGTTQSISFRVSPIAPT